MKKNVSEKSRERAISGLLLLGNHKKHYHRTVTFREKKLWQDGFKDVCSLLPLVGVSWSYLTMLALYFSCVGKQKKNTKTHQRKVQKFLWPEKSRSHTFQPEKSGGSNTSKIWKEKRPETEKRVYYIPQRNECPNEQKPERKKKSYSLELLRVIFYGLYHGIDHHEKPRYVSKSIKQSQIYEEKTKKNIIWWNKKSSLPLWNLVFVGSDLFEVHWLIPVSIGAAGLLGGFQRSPINPKGGNRWKWGWL